MCSQRPKIHKSSLLESSRQHTQSRPLPCDPFSSFVFEKNLQLHTRCVRVCMSQGTPMKSEDHLHSYFSPCTTLVPEPELKLGGSASVWRIILRNIFHTKPISSLPDPCLRGSKFLSCQSPSSQLLQHHRHLSSCDATWTIKNAFPPNHEVRMRSHRLPSYTISVASDQSVGSQSQDIVSRYTCCPLLSLR